MFIRETKSEIINIVKLQIDEIKCLKDEISTKEDYDIDAMNYGNDGEKKTILKPAQANSAKLALAAQTCLFQLTQQIDAFSERIQAMQTRKEPTTAKDLANLSLGFINATKTIRTRNEFKEIFGGKK